MAVAACLPHPGPRLNLRGMEPISGPRMRGRHGRSRRLGDVPIPILTLLIVLLVTGPILLAMTDRGAPPPADPSVSLAQVVRRAGCDLTEFDTDPRSNPPVSGRVDERVTAEDGSYVGRTAPSPLAATHALLHGRVLVQYRPELSEFDIARLDRFVRRDRAGALLFANQTDMPQPVAATAYLSLMTCTRVDAQTIDALRAFREWRGNFGQRF
jgi:hypothetical protein